MTLRDQSEKAMPWHQQGTHPDYRFSLANERTFLAWIRTALALLAGALVLQQFARDLQPRGILVVVTLLLSIMAALLSATAWWRWRSNEHAMRLGKQLPTSPVIALVAWTLALIASALTWILLV